MSVNAVGDNSVEQRIVVELLRSDQPDQTRIAVVKVGHGVEQMRHESSAVSNGFLALLKFKYF